MGSITIKVEVADAILDYLTRQPYKEVAELVKALKGAESFEEEVARKLAQKNQKHRKKRLLERIALTEGIRHYMQDTSLDIIIPTEELDTPEEVAVLTTD